MLEDREKAIQQLKNIMEEYKIKAKHTHSESKMKKFCDIVESCKFVIKMMEEYK